MQKPWEREWSVGDAAPKPWEREWNVSGPSAKAPTIADDVAALPGKAWDAVLPGKAWDAVKEKLTGEKRREAGIDELPDAFIPGFGSIAHRMALARDDAGKLDIYKKAYPKAQSRQDAHGNVIVTGEDGKEYYLNRPGLSAQDAYDFGTEAAFMLPAAKAGAAVGKILGMIGKVGGTGGATGAASVVQDKAAQAAGSEQPVDQKRAVISAGVGAGAEMLAPAVSALGRATGIIKGPEMIDAAGNLTQAGKDTMKRAGIDPNTVTQEFRQTFARQAESAAAPAQAARTAEAQTLPVPVPTTKGIQTLSPSDQMFEDLAGKGVYGDLASGVVRNRRAEIDDALHRNVPAIQSKIAGGVPLIAQTGEAGPRVQQALVDTAAKEKAGVDAAYKTAREARAGVRGRFVDDLKMTVGDAIATDHNLKGLPRTSALLEDLASFSGDANTSTSIRPLFEWRKRLVNAQQAGGEEAVALGKAKKAFDAKMDEALGKALLQGDDKAIDAFKVANATNRAYASRFKGSDVIEALVTKEPRSGQMVLATAPEAASNAIFGSSRLFGGANTARDVARLKEVLGPDSPQWNSLREEAWLRLARAGEGPQKPDGGRAFSGAKFATAVDNTMRDHPALMQTLFSADELATIQQFKRVAARSTIPVEGGKNFSNTTPAMANVVQRLANAAFIGEGAATRLMTIPLVKSLYGSGMAVKALDAMRPGVKKLGLDPGAAGGAAATIYDRAAE